ncbi:quinone oxidoreductase [Ignatzschineria indica]|uniref:NADPH:quinone reductase n=1 Tax=Ignatzschineria indica TaxID=472583 RepID=A0A2U2AIT0_9GAMM|nr:quinone oxidoreductase [Ignatzschineria indica]PWD82578.1 quinone oxidoreductase [Ignatzschineria indica]GGZ85055.1 quinone oxidoreductase [Ignatzschineria indica]
MSYQIILKEQGDISNFEKVEITLPAPKEGEVRIEQKAIGLNFIDTYHRDGLYALETPTVIGQEGAGIITAVGKNVTQFNIGDRVCYASVLGAYASERNIATDRLIKIPSSISYEEAASSLIRGGTASYLLFDLFQLKPEHTTLIHAGAGGVGQILIQWAKAIGATVITTVSTEEKADVVRALGADLVINYRTENFVEKVRQFIPEGVDVVYDGVGKETFIPSLDTLKPLGMMVSFGNASGAPPAISPLLLLEKGSLFLTRPNLNAYTSTKERYRTVMDRWFLALSSGKIKLSLQQKFPLSEVGRAHQALENREIIGSAVLIP